MRRANSGRAGAGHRGRRVVAALERARRRIHRLANNAVGRAPGAGRPRGRCAGAAMAKHSRSRSPGGWAGRRPEPGEIGGLRRARPLDARATPPRRWGDRRGRRQAGLQALHQAGAARGRVRRRALELSVSDRRQRRSSRRSSRATSCCSSLGADPFTRRTIREAFDRRACRPACSSICISVTRGAADRGERRGSSSWRFTGSVGGGHAVQGQPPDASSRTNLELGGKDPAYVREDADLGQAVESLVDGACFNWGQSSAASSGSMSIRAGSRSSRMPMPNWPRSTSSAIHSNQATNLGPMVRASAADFARGQIDEADRAPAS